MNYITLYCLAWTNVYILPKFRFKKRKDYGNKIPMSAASMSL